MHAARTWPDRLALVHGELVARLPDSPETTAPAEVSRTWHRIRSAGGSLGVDVLAREVGCSRRQLSRRFGQELGVSPTLTRRLVRFAAAARLVGRSGGEALAQVAAVCGFADQSHMGREFAAFAGCSPARLMDDAVRRHTAPTFKTASTIGDQDEARRGTVPRTRVRS